MSDDGLAEGNIVFMSTCAHPTINNHMSAETSKIAINAGEQNGDISFAATRLAREARQAMSFGSRGVRDVTAEFDAAAKQLQPGELVKDEYFTLFEAVGAIEVNSITLHVRCFAAD